MTTSEYQEERWKGYFFERHSMDEMKRWTNQIHLFRYFRAFGGQANDGDSLDLAIKYNDEHELISIFEILNIKYLKLNSLPEQPIKGKPYSPNDNNRFPNLIENTKWIIQPGHTQLFGISVFISCYKNTIKISINSHPYEVIEADIESAKVLEEQISKLRLVIQDPPFDTRNYLCPKYHKDLFDS